MKRKIIIALLVGSIISLTGCGNKIPELTEEQKSLVATYASDLVVQYSPEHDTRLIDIEQEAKRREEIAEKAAKVQEIIDAQKEAEAKEKEIAEAKLNNTEVRDGTEKTIPLGTIGDMQSFLGIDDLTLTYQGYELTKSYPSEETSEWTPTIEATSGQTLLVASFGVENSTDSNIFADMLSQNAQFRLISDEAEGTNMATMLLNDFAYMQEELEPGAEKEFVIITQVDEEVMQASNLKLYVKKGDSNITVGLE
ncbi:MAG: hypothetical protein E7299_02490 [Lachnospiraceae bacterium]|nr:hypothetical protein [Lachnospiraceae bacterium]